LLAKRQVGNRNGRIEPRAVKKSLFIIDDTQSTS
jgi:hypothetical protein